MKLHERESGDKSHLCAVDDVQSDIEKYYHQDGVAALPVRDYGRWDESAGPILRSEEGSPRQYNQASPSNGERNRPLRGQYSNPISHPELPGQRGKGAPWP